MVEVQVPDARGDELAVGLDLDHARLEAGDVALGRRAGGEDAGVAGAADLLTAFGQVWVMPKRLMFCPG